MTLAPLLPGYSSPPTIDEIQLQLDALDARVTVLEGGGSSTVGNVIDITAAPYSVVVGVSTDAQALLNRTGIIAAHAFAKSEATAGRIKELAYPDGVIHVSYSRAYNNNVDGQGRILIDWPGAVLRGAGKNRTVIRARSRRDTLARRLSFTDDTVSSGRQASRAGNVITLGGGQAVNFTGLKGCELYFSPNSDGSSPRVMTDNIVLENSSTGANTITISDATEVTGLSNNDYVFVKNRLALTTIADAANYTNPDFNTPTCEVYASPNANGSSPRVGAAPVINVNLTTGVLTLGVRTDTSISTWVNGDYLFGNFGFMVFEHRMAADADTGTVYDLTIRDMTVDAEFYGGSDNPAIVGENPTGDVVTQGIGGNATLGGPASVEYTVSFIDLVVSDAYENIFFVGGTTAATSLRLERVSTSGGRGGVFMTCSASSQTKTFRAMDCDFYSTDPVLGSHNNYINPQISMHLVGNRYHDRPAAKYAYQHWGTANTGNKFTNVVGNTVMGAGNGFLTNEHSSESFSGNIFVNDGAAIQVRSSCSITGGIVRKTSTSSAISSYADCQYDAHVKVIGVDFDFRDASYIAIEVAIPTRWTIVGNTFTALDTAQGAGEPQDASGSTCIAVQTTSYDASQLSEVKMSDNIFNFNTTTGTVDCLVIFAAVNVDFLNNNWKGRCPTGDAVIRITGTQNGSGRFRIRGNTIDAYGGGCVKVSATFSNTPSLEITENNMTTHLANRDTIELSYTNTCPTRVRGNRLNSVDAAITVGANPPAMDITGGDNEIVAGTLITAGNRQGLRMRDAQKSSNVTAAASTSFDPNFDTFVMTDTGAINVDSFTLNATASTLLLHDGARIMVIFSTGNMTLTNAGNITERVAMAGARPAGSAAMFKYNVTLAKWVEV